MDKIRLKRTVTANPTQFYSVSISGISFLLATCESREWIASQLLYNTVSESKLGSLSTDIKRKFKFSRAYYLEFT